MIKRRSEQVFISSTCLDLIDLRSEVAEHVRSLDFEPVLSDVESRFSVDGSSDAVETCLVNLRSCATVVVILSRRYGSIVPSKGKSVTHLEYEEAVKHGIPTLFYVRDDLLAWYNLVRDVTASLKLLPGMDDATGASGLRDFIKARESQAGDRKSNWIRAFRTSHDLKRVLTTDLMRESSAGILEAMARRGELPTFAIKNESGSGSQWHVCITNISGAAAYDIDFRICNQSSAMKILALGPRQWSTQMVDYGQHLKGYSPYSDHEYRAWSAVEFTVASGMRIEEIFGCKWHVNYPTEYVRLARRLISNSAERVNFEILEGDGIKRIRLLPNDSLAGGA